jgi:hypothetical protein
MAAVMAAAWDLRPGWKVKHRQNSSIRLRGWGEDRGAGRQVRRLDPSARVGVPVGRPITLRQSAETTDSAHVAERRAHATVGQPLGLGSGTVRPRAEDLASAGRVDPVLVFRVARGVRRLRVLALDAET